ncbi:hypothetical protein NC653_007661 [Populus alba x Populus x berolinensis]|uniref:Uncharacterized protein n=1 Tax=Populus alba x Populus x berolinensis TaxID=444605 RepID=A0AAD6RHF6_9ROSI|nr:hypothetical protein NC653_007661 [Populus alba x Populus x berolinensis]
MATVSGKGRELSGGRSVGRLSSGGAVQLEVRLESGMYGKRQATAALAKGRVKEKRGNAEARLYGEENGEGDGEGSGREILERGEKKFNF